MSCAPAALAARSTASASGSTFIRAMFSEMVPSNSSTVCEMKPTCWPSRSGSHWSSAAPSSRTLPLAGRQMPTRARTSEVLPAPLGPMMPSASPALRPKRTLATTGFVPPGRDDRDLLDLEAALGLRQRGRRPLRRGARERLRQPRDALAGADEGAPVRDGGLDRSERAAHHDRGGDHGAGGQFLPDHEIGAEPEDHRLQQEPQHLRDAAEGAGDVAQAGGGRDIAVVDPGPALRQRTAHAHRHDGLAVAALRLHHDRAPARVLREHAAPARGWRARSGASS